MTKEIEEIEDDIPLKQQSLQTHAKHSRVYMSLLRLLPKDHNNQLDFDSHISFYKDALKKNYEKFLCIFEDDLDSLIGTLNLYKSRFKESKTANSEAKIQLFEGYVNKFKKIRDVIKEDLEDKPFGFCRNTYTYKGGKSRKTLRKKNKNLSKTIKVKV
jgi:hypothetical protein